MGPEFSKQAKAWQEINKICGTILPHINDYLKTLMYATVMG